MCLEPESGVVDEMVPIDDLIYKTFVDKFNKEYNDRLHEEQRALLEKYIMSFVDNGIELKIFLNEELTRIKNVIGESLSSKELTEDLEMKEKTEQVLNMIKGYQKIDVGEAELIKILKAQNLTREIGN